MRRIQRFGLATGLALGLTLLCPPAFAADPKPEVESLGRGPAYDALAHLPVLHEGRVKPLDTLAREEIKQIYGRETVKLLNAKGEVTTSWSAVATFIDLLARPDYWNDQRIISVEFLPLKAMILADSVKTQLAAIAGKVSDADKLKIEPLLKADVIKSEDLKSLLKATKFSEADANEIFRLSLLLGEGQKWLSFEEIEHAQVKVDGREIPALVWFDELTKKERSARTAPAGEIRLTELERRGFDLGARYARYQALRDSAKDLQTPWRMFPRPSNPAYLTFSGDALEKARTQGPRTLSRLELETAVILKNYSDQIAAKEWAKPGSNAEFDARYTNWLKANSAWMPVAAVTVTPTEELGKAGFNTANADSFKAAFLQALEAERTSPGKIDPAKVTAFLQTARELASEANPVGYPSEKVLNREVSFNVFGPFFWAPWVYATGTILLLLSLAVPNSRLAILSALRRALYYTGMAGFLGGILLEIYGFSQRVQISGWAPVTNMYETVIWVGLVTSLIGLTLEAIYRRTYAALAASGVAMVCTMLAASVPLLDPKIAGLQPVLRSNLWLTIHVLTIVSSYAAFALALGLGLIALCYYLTAVYRHEASYLSLGRWLPVALVILGGGTYGVLYTDSGQPLGDWTEKVWYISWFVLVAGLITTTMFATAMLGELISRWRFEHLVKSEFAGLIPISGGAPDATSSVMDEPATEVEPPASVEPEDMKLRELAMRDTASKIKSLSNFIYRSMQVGVLLVAAGTILGGVWADYSWGRFWGWDPKEVWALITLLVYLIPLHGRFAGWVNTFGLVFSSVVCFTSVLMAWYGVNFILGVGLHSYGFVEGGSQGSVTLVASVILAFAVGVWWRRSACTQSVA